MSLSELQRRNFIVNFCLENSNKITQQQRLSRLFARPHSQRRFCCGWLPVFFKAGLAVKKEVYISKCLAVLHKFIQQHHKNEKIVFSPDLASDYAKDTLVRLEELNILTVFFQMSFEVF
jgi:hypothetical protein